jgi:DNA polymerase III subunit epsilon
VSVRGPSVAPVTPRAGTRHPSPTGTQISFGELGTPLQDVTFVVVDLETTGGAPVDAGITEIGAVKVRGGEVIGSFQTLVNPGAPIPPFVAALTGITDALVASAPALAGVLPAFLEFAHGAVLVAHNAPYDMGFLKGGCAQLGHAWPDPVVVDTARLARVALHRDEVRNCKLATLAAHFRATVSPTHRAYDDARATADVLHALIERAGDLGVTTLEDLQEFASRVSAAQRTKRHLAQDLPDAPGVYVFQDAQGVALYVGTSRSIRTRVRTYFTASEQRRRMAEMVRIAERVVPIVCATTLEARVRELRLIAAEQPRYNRRSRRPDAQSWLKLTDEPAPRLAVVRQVSDDHAAGARYLGPFSSRAAAEAATEALLLAYPLRTCTSRLARRPRTSVPGCALAELGRCLAPCTAQGDRSAYDELVAGARAAMSGDLRTVATTVEHRMGRLADEERYEEAAQWRERLSQLAGASVRTHRLAMLAGAAEVVAARPTPDHGWEIHVLRHGRLAGAGIAPPGHDPRPVVDALTATAEHVEPSFLPSPAGLTEETHEVLAWLDSDGVRLVRTDAGLELPVHCGGELVDRLAAARQASQRNLIGDDYRATAPGGRPLGPVDARPVTRMLSA